MKSYFEGSSSVRRVVYDEGGSEVMMMVWFKDELPFWVKFEHDIIIISTCGSTAATA